MIIRVAVKNDVENIAKLYISNWKETYKGLLSEDYLNSLTKELQVKLETPTITLLQVDLLESDAASLIFKTKVNENIYKLFKNAKIVIEPKTGINCINL